MYLLKFTDCIISKGKDYSLIIDLNRNYYLKFSNTAIEYLETLLNQPYDESSIHDSFKVLINLLIESEILFLTESPDNFPEINFNNWDYYSHITHAVIECKPQLYRKVFEVLGELLCYNFIINYRIKNSEIESFFEGIELCLNDKTFDGVDIYIEVTSKPNSEEINFLLNFINKNPTVYNIFISNSEIEEVHYSNHAQTRFIKSITDSYFPLNKIHLNPNLYTYSESFRHNVYFNRKLYIGKEGQIKNSPDSDLIFGYISDSSNSINVLEIVQTKEFHEKWKITKDKIINCIGCPYNRICVDSDPLIKTAKNQYQRTEKCMYESQI